MQAGILVNSTVQGRYALDDPQEGREFTSGDVVTILLGGHYIAGTIEHSRKKGGYYFVAHDDGTVCGLCPGMHVRVE
jgi:hypothetical protein